MSSVISLIDEIYSAVEEPDLWRELPQKIARKLGAHASSVQQQPIGADECAAVQSFGFPEDPLRDYYANWDRKNLWRRRGLAHVLSKPQTDRFEAVHLSRLAPPGEMRATPAFNESLAKMDLYDCIAMPLSVEGDAMWAAFFCGKS